jgi:hypothetical protein
LREAEKRKRRGDRFFLVRQHEHFLFAAGICKCPENTCGGCRATLGIAGDLLKHIAADSDLERDRARAFVRAEAADLGQKLAIIAQRTGAYKARREGRSTPEAVRAASIRQADWHETERE